MQGKSTLVYVYDITGKLLEIFNSISECARKYKRHEKCIRVRLKKKYIYDNRIFSTTLLNSITGYTDKQNNKEKDGIAPNILFLDIETAPIRAYVWRLWKENVGLDQIISNWFMLTWSAKWSGEKDIMSDKLIPSEVKNEDDSRIIKKLWMLLDMADIVVAHNGDIFDLPKISSRFVIHNMPPPSSYKQIDTCKIAQKQFGFSSNKLDALAQLFGFGCKIDTTFELWVKCMEGDKDALKCMEEYNRQDVALLEKIYFKLRPHIKSHPNMDMFYDDKNGRCTLCGSKNIELVEDKSYYTQACKYQLYRCKNCGGLSRSKRMDKFEYKKTISPIPK